MHRTQIIQATVLALALSGCSEEPSVEPSGAAASGAAASGAAASGAAASGAAVLAVPAIKTAGDTTALADLYREATRTLFTARPVSATLYGLGEQELGFKPGDRLDDYSPAAERVLRGRLREISGQISGAPALAGESEETNRAIMANVTRYFAGHADFPVGYIDTWMGLSPFIVNQINGPLLDIPRYLQESQPVNSLQDAEDYLARLAAFDKLMTGIGEKLASDAESGWIAPRVILQGALDYIGRFTEPEPRSHALVANFAKRLEGVSDLSTDRRQALVERAEIGVAETVYPAFRAIADATRTLLARAPSESGIWAQPRGEQYYRDAIRFLGDSDLDADEIHAVGLAEIERIEQAMDALLRQEGYNRGSVGERMVALSEEERFLYADSPEGRQTLLADLNQQIEDMTALMAPWFKTTPPYAVEVRAFPEDIQEGMPGGQYQSPPLDGSTPGIYWINLRDMQAVPSFALKTLTYHEANPGHHWQIALNLAQEDFPFLRRMSPYNAYAEGWALYAEQVAAELGVYDDDPFGDLGRLQDEMFRAVRLVVDTGLHHKRWTREQAIAFMSEATGKPASEVVAEIERYMTWPGQALGYKLGMLKILALREQAKSALGEKFDLAGFHDLLLLGGAMPMAVLEQRVQRWITNQAGN